MGCRVQKIALGARGLRIRFQVVERNAAGKLVPVDLTDAATAPGFVHAFFRTPSGEVRLVACVVETPATAGVAYYATEDGFLDEFGEWEAQALVSIPGVDEGEGFFPSLIVDFEVEPLLRPFVPLLGPAAPAAVELPVELPAPLVA